MEGRQRTANDQSEQNESADLHVQYSPINDEADFLKACFHIVCFKLFGPCILYLHVFYHC